MSKFLTIVEENLPLTDIDVKTEAKRDLEKFFYSVIDLMKQSGRKEEVNISAKTFRDEVVVTLPNGKVIELEIKSVRLPKQEEQEDVVDKLVSFKIDPERDLKLDPRVRDARERIVNATQRIATKFQTAAEKI